MDGEAWWATVHGVAKSRTRLSDFISYTFGGGSSFFHATYFDIYAYYCVYQ